MTFGKKKPSRPSGLELARDDGISSYLVFVGDEAGIPRRRAVVVGGGGGGPTGMELERREWNLNDGNEVAPAGLNSVVFFPT